MKGSARTFWAMGTAAIMLALTACGSESTDPGSSSSTDDGDAVLIGVSLVNQTEERWIAEGNALKAGLEELGYEVDLQYADSDIPRQTQQIDSMITKGADLLIISPIDGSALSSQVESAQALNVPIISYDRLITGNDDVELYISFDNYTVGEAQARSLLYGLGITDEDGAELPDRATGPFYIELFAGSPDDNNSIHVWNGGLDVLTPYIDDGTLVVKSGQVTRDQAAILNWEQERAQRRMEDLLTSTYQGEAAELAAVLGPNDALARGIITALQGNGLGPTIDEGLPLVSGQDAELANVTLISKGVQFSTVFKDTRKLAGQAVIAAQDLLAGNDPESNATYDNGGNGIPAYLFAVDVVYKDTVGPLLVDTGFWTAEEVEAGVKTD